MDASDLERQTTPNQHPATADDPSPTWPGLAIAARRSGVDLAPAATVRFAHYRDLLIEWNQRFNLTAIADPALIEERLFLDAVRMVPTIDHYRASGAVPDQQPLLVIDIGSGAGLPGMPLAICRPELEVTLVEATRKKVAFLNEVGAALDLPNVTAVHARAEDLGHLAEYRGRYHLATARAVASLPALVELALPLLRLQGLALFPKGDAIATELETGRRAAFLLGGQVMDTAFLPGGETRLVTIRKINPTPSRYPRRSGIPAREPLGRRGPS